MFLSHTLTGISIYCTFLLLMCSHVWNDLSQNLAQDQDLHSNSNSSSVPAIKCMLGFFGETLDDARAGP